MNIDGRASFWLRLARDPSLVLRHTRSLPPELPVFALVQLLRTLPSAHRVSLSSLTPCCYLGCL